MSTFLLVATWLALSVATWGAIHHMKPVAKWLAKWLVRHAPHVTHTLFPAKTRYQVGDFIFSATPDGLPVFRVKAIEVRPGGEPVYQLTPVLTAPTSTSIH